MKTMSKELIPNSSSFGRLCHVQRQNITKCSKLSNDGQETGSSRASWQEGCGDLAKAVDVDATKKPKKGLK